MGWKSWSAAGVALVLVAAAVVFGYLRGGEEPPARYVALGDSYTAAPGTGQPVGTPPGCGRSDNNYPRLVRNGLTPAEFVDVSCGGATTEHLSSPQRTREGTNPPQLAAVTAGTTHVTLGIGGNDVGFVTLGERCATRDRTATPCRDRFTSGGRDRLAEAVAEAAPRVGRALERIRERAPDARVVVVGYPAILPADPAACWPELPYGTGDVTYLRRSIERLNAMLAEQARDHGAEFADTARATRGHSMCAAPSARWIEGPEPVTGAAPLHPTARGQRAMADAVLPAVS
ncbi:lysophospholipase L1-like esterase [Prauserella shujinwangii]|uniref:Lysophospholipase L1-like esterase n=1 Tax=Prauserella shujinwangii TaxID=1453103 RepID=A0A2T0LLI7_9PSEU|nr:SGNH/GDSL hydrolase family protein [Prauserella shujinwangii]PRX43901.1 lysophospholipase L1-like esterase [Prauserella shujinwangii]